MSLKLVHDAAWGLILFVAANIAALLPRNRGLSAVCIAYEMGRKMERSRRREIDDTTVQFNLDPATVPLKQP